MTEMSKGRSPFYPGQPVPVELFVGRKNEIELILNRGVAQVAQGKPAGFFVQGDYGIGKTSIAIYTQAVASKSFGLHGIYASLGGSRTVADVATAIMEATIRSGSGDSRLIGILREWIPQYIRAVDLFGVTVDIEALRQDAGKLSSSFGILDFLRQAFQRVQGVNVRGMFLIMDEINGIAREPEFAALLKGLWDTNAVARPPVPLLLILCGVEERRRDLIKGHPAIDRILEVVQIDNLSEADTREFFQRAFATVNTTLKDQGLDVLVRFSAGLPKFMHQIGDNAFWVDKDGIIDIDDALDGVLAAADDIGRKYVDQQVIQALRSRDYRSILKKIAAQGIFPRDFHIKTISKGLTETEKKKLHNFLQRMLRLGVLRHGEIRGEYVFSQQLVRVYLSLLARREQIRGGLNKATGSQ